MSGPNNPSRTWADVRAYVLPTDQTTFADDPGGGNCIQAVVASIVREPLEAVPHFYRFRSAWIDAVGVFLRLWGISVEKLPNYDRPLGLSIAVGLSPRGVDHCVLYLHDELIHDPHPSRAGLESIKYSVQLWNETFARIQEEHEAIIKAVK